MGFAKSTPVYTAVFLGLAIALLVACGSEPAATAEPTATPVATPTATPAPSPTPTPAVQITPDTPSAQTILESSFAAMERTRSFRFELEATVKASAQGGAVLEIPFAFAADYQAPDRVRGKLALNLAFFTVERETVIIGDQVYTTDPETGEWSVSVGSGIKLPSPRDFTTGAATALEKAVLARIEALDGDLVYVIEGAPSLDLFVLSEKEPETTFWIGIDDLLIRRIAANGQISLEEIAGSLGLSGMAGTATIAVDIRFSGFGTPVEILAPAVGEGAKTGGPGRRVEDQGRAHVPVRGPPSALQLRAGHVWLALRYTPGPGPLGRLRRTPARRGAGPQPGARRGRGPLRLPRRLRRPRRAAGRHRERSHRPGP